MDIMVIRDEALSYALPLVPKVRAISDEVLSQHIQRGDMIKAIWLSLISRRPAFFLGSPGVDKTDTTQALANRIVEAIFYDELMPVIASVEQFIVESTSIEEEPMANGGKSIYTKDRLGRAAAAHVVFADEIWKAEPRVLQTLLDLAKGGSVRHEGQLVRTPLLSFLSASNELPDPEGNLGAIWSRMTIRVQVQPLDRGGKTALVKARLNRDRTRSNAQDSATQLTLADVENLRQARPYVEVSDDIINMTLDILQELVDDPSSDFAWAWADDRRFGRLFDVMQANALLNGRTQVTKQDLAVLEWLLWDTPEQIAIVKAKVAPYCRTPLMDAQELLDTLLAPGGTVAEVLNGNRAKGVQALTQCESADKELNRLKAEVASDSAMVATFEALREQLAVVKNEVIASITGVKPQGGA